MSNLSGKPPKTSSEIRGKLRAIQGATPDVTSGKSSPQSVVEHQIVVGEFHEVELARSLQAGLQQVGVYSSLIAYRRRSVVLVDQVDLPVASDFARRFRLKHVDRRPVQDARRFDGLILGTMIGVTMGLVLNLEGDIPFRAWPQLLQCSALGIVLGALFDRLFSRRRFSGRRVELADFLLIVALIPVVGYAFIWMRNLLFDSP